MASIERKGSGSEPEHEARRSSAVAAEAQLLRRSVFAADRGAPLSNPLGDTFDSDLPISEAPEELERTTTTTESKYVHAGKAAIESSSLLGFFSRHVYLVLSTTTQGSTVDAQLKWYESLPAYLQGGDSLSSFSLSPLSRITSTSSKITLEDSGGVKGTRSFRFKVPPGAPSLEVWSFQHRALLQMLENVQSDEAEVGGSRSAAENPHRIALTRTELGGSASTAATDAKKRALLKMQDLMKHLFWRRI